MAKISFNTGDRPFVFQQKLLLRSFIESIFKKEKKQLAGLRYVFCSDDMLLDINRNFLQHDYYTDIITFGLSEKGQPIEGEIYISIDRVKDNAQMLGINYKEEMLRVLFHGALHLCGYKDKTKSEIITMRAKEDRYLQLFGKA
ncbi:MAG TPA: rRNA maturation RNase YbeY [Sediminibacterium sp.]|nr:rRNA maturation RNase YbeY [Sediminibacterium sp.]